MRVELTPELRRYVDQQVASGRYASAADVVRAGLEALHRVERERRVAEAHVEALRREIALGIDDLRDGRSKPFDEQLVAEVCARGRKRLAKERRTGSAA